MQLSRDNVKMAVQLGQLEKERGQARAEHLQLQHEIEELKAQAQDQQPLEACWSKELQANERLRTELATSQADLEAARDRRRLSDADLSRLGGRLKSRDEMLAGAPMPPAVKVARAAKAVPHTLKAPSPI